MPKFAKISQKMQISIGQRLQLPDGGNLSLNVMPSHFAKQLSQDESDLLNLHWVQGEMISVGQILRIKKKIAWTLHDPWLFNGIGHYSYEEATGRFSFVEGVLEKALRFRKNSILKLDSKFISPSRWLADRAMKSGITSKNIAVIPNPLPFNIFSPVEKLLARTSLNLPANGIIILIGSASTLSDPRKGSDLAILLLSQLKKKFSGLLTIISIGPDSAYPKELGVISFGYITNDDHLRLIYSCADFSFLSSRIDNLPQFMTESLSCGTPVVAFKSGGAVEVLSDSNLGGLVSLESMSSAINEFTELIEQRHYFKTNLISNIARDKWSSSRLVNDYEDFLNS